MKERSIERCRRRSRARTGEGELGQRDVAVQAVVDETYADALRLHLHAGQRGGQAAGGQGAAGVAVSHHVLHVLQQPRGSLVQLAYETDHTLSPRASCSLAVYLNTDVRANALP